MQKVKLVLVKGQDMNLSREHWRDIFEVSTNHLIFNEDRVLLRTNGSIYLIFMDDYIISKTDLVISQDLALLIEYEIINNHYLRVVRLLKDLLCLQDRIKVMHNHMKGN